MSEVYQSANYVSSSPHLTISFVFSVPFSYAVSIICIRLRVVAHPIVSIENCLKLAPPDLRKSVAFKCHFVVKAVLKNCSVRSY